MDATQMICDSILESDEEENEEENTIKTGRPLAKLCILKNEHIPETELPLFLGDNVLGRDPNNCTLPLPAPSISKQHATICVSVYRRRGYHSKVDVEALVWDLGSMNGTHKGHLKLTPNVRYALSERERLVVADIPCLYVSCAVDTVPSQGDMRTPVSSKSGVKAPLPDASGEKGGDTITGSKKCVIGGTKTRVSSPDQEDTRETPVRTNCLSFEQTPTQSQGTLVPESGSDSDGERGDRRRKALVSDSDSYKSSPTCSTFLSPPNKIVPESEDESPITPSSSTKNRPYRHVSFSKEETDLDVGQQQPIKKKAPAVVDDSEEEEEREEERATLRERTSGDKKSSPHRNTESGQDVPVKQESNVSLTGEDELPVSTPSIFTDLIPAFDMDSDTDMEGDEEGVVSAGPVTMNTNQQADQPPDTSQLYMDSDTDVDEDDYVSDKVPKSLPSSADHSNPTHVISVIQPEGITMDSDTDVDDEDAAVSDAGTKAKPTSIQSTHTTDSAPSPQLKDFHLDSDTDVDEEEEKKHETNTTCSTIDETPTKLDIKPLGPDSNPPAPHSLHPDSDTDDEVIPALAISEPLMTSAVTESSTSADAGAELCILCDSDTDVEDDLVIPVAVPILSVGPGITTAALQSELKADVNPDDLRVDSDTDVEDEKVDIGEAGEGQIPSFPRENTPGFLVPLKQNCSTPIQVSEREVEDMETQAFLSPSTGPFRRVVAPAIRPIPLSTVSDSQEDDEFVVAETQSFVLQTRDCQANPPEDHTMDPTQAFDLDSSGDEHGEQSNRGGSVQLGSSDSNHLQAQAQAQALAMESTQAFVQCVNLEDTQEYAAISSADRTSMQNDSNLEATQAYGENEEPVQCLVMSAKEGQLDLALEATQAYLLEPSSEDESSEDERKNTATAETQAFDFPTSSTLAMAETQPMSALEEEEEEEEEESLNKENPISSVIEVKSTPQNGTDEREEHGEAAKSQKSHLSEALSLAETQPMRRSDNEESEDEDFLLGPQIIKANPLQLGEEQTQRLPNSELSAVDTQPMNTGEDGEIDEEDWIPGPRKRRAKQLQHEEETQPLGNSEVSVVETQPMGRGDREQSDEEDSSPGPRKRTARPQQIQEEETQPLTNFESSTVETLQPPRGKGRQSEAGTSGTTIRGTRGTRARLTEAEEQAECSEPPKRQTRGKNKALPTTRGRRGKARPDEEESEEEEEVVQAKGAGGKKSMREQKSTEERLETERNKHAEKANLMKEQEERREAKLEMERKEKEEKERSQAKIAKRLRLEWERAEKDRIDRERKEQEEKKRAGKAQKEIEEQLGREREEKEEKERLEHENAEREEKERLEMEKGQEQGEKESLQTAKREQEERLEREKKEQEHQARLEKEATEREEQESLEKRKQEENKPKTPARSRRTARTTAALRATEPERDSTVSANDFDDVPARRTRSRSNSSNSVSSERSAPSVNTQGSRGKGRGAKGTSRPPQAAIVRSTNRRSTVAAEATRVTSNDVSPRGVRSRSNSTNSEISSCSVSSQGRGHGGRQRGRGRKTEAEPHSIPPFNSQSEPNLAPKPTARGRKAEESSNEVRHEDENEKSDSQQASTTRGRRRANENSSEPAAADKQGPSNQEERCASEDSPLPKRNVRGRCQKAVKSETVEALVAPATSDGDEAKDKRKGRKRELQANKEEDSSSSSKVFKGKEKAQTPEAAEEEANCETNDDIPVRAKRRGRASSAQAKKNAKDSPTEGQVKEESEKMEEETIERRGKGRPSMVQKKKKEEQGESGTSVEQDVEASEPQAPTSSGSRKRQAPVDSSPVAKTPRSSSASPAVSGRLRPSSQDYKVLFTGVVDEGGERVLARLGGSMAKGVADMNCLVTDKVRRTVKFLCAVAKGVPIVTTHWLEKSGKAGSFLSPSAFIVKDLEQEKKFNFCLQESLRIASSQSLLQGYDIHVTKSVKPEPVHMKDIISCSGATFLSKMPSSHKPQTVVISCEEDWLLCGPALSASLPVVTAEFILTGILQQKLDLQTHTLSAPGNTVQPAGGRGRGRKKS
ncbi:LOW QUALITY PROTEIN: mediator of DNA damage checkpoint protein 1 [Etheostoma spectabile]|uniref:LOW QUALITY PROTEIN: mediator of DNA damage checkpoint protein 1 n=1 Tax=Etheostoma spectabile TaxID=54343 RepID=UPI0013AF3B15|nr:LOW QUALITY PROTEIN: mediator of DNA damage checkpoint protein 1 [Etheostoma spectabile]